MTFVFLYHSQTQRIVHYTPFAVSFVIFGWLIYLNEWRSDRWKGDVAGAFFFFGAGWFVLENWLVNRLIERFGTRIGPLDFSRNVNPTTTERVLMYVILFLAVISGLAATITIVNIQKGGGLEAALFFGSGAFVIGSGFVFLILTFCIIIFTGFRIRPVRL
jgi:hypothetical protein